MASSIAAYASQFLNGRPPTRTNSSQPIFFSFTTDNGSRTSTRNSDLDDGEDPHFRESQDDPYLKLDGDSDEDELPPGASRSLRMSQSLRASASQNQSRGWLAHASPLRSSPIHEASPAESEPPPLPPPTTTTHISLAESQHVHTRHAIFSLPDPRHATTAHIPHNDPHWTASWLLGVTICLVSCVVVLFTTHKPSEKASKGALPYTNLLHTVPLLTILTILSALMAYAHVYLLRLFVKPVMIGTEVFVPSTLLISALWAFIGSFMWEEGYEPTWGESVGLRIFALIPLTLSLITFRRLAHRLPQQLHTTSSLLNLTTAVLIQQPLLLALSPAILLAILLISIPFITLIFRLLLIGYFLGADERGNGINWHFYARANWAIAGSICIWVWTWGVGRGILRITCAAVVGAWYFSDPRGPQPAPFTTHTLHAALHRATGPSLGTTVLAALLLTVIQIISTIAWVIRMLPFYFPFNPVARVAGFIVPYLETAISNVSDFVLIYAGLSGDTFWESARRAGGLVSQRRKSKKDNEAPLKLLKIAPLTLCLPFSILTYLFVAHTLYGPGDALGAAMLAGGVTALVGVFCTAVVRDTADTLYMCYLLDREAGERRRDDVFLAFEYQSTQAQPIPAPQPGPSRQRDFKRPVPVSKPSLQPVHAPPRSHPFQPPPEPEHLLSSPSEPSSPLLHGVSPPKAEANIASSRRVVTPPKPDVNTAASRHGAISHIAEYNEPEDEDIDPFERSYRDDDLPRSALMQESAGSATLSDSDESSSGERMIPSGFL